MKRTAYIAVRRMPGLLSSFFHKEFWTEFFISTKRSQVKLLYNTLNVKLIPCKFKRQTFIAKHSNHITFSGLNRSDMLLESLILHSCISTFVLVCKSHKLYLQTAIQWKHKLKNSKCLLTAYSVSLPPEQ